MNRIWRIAITGTACLAMAGCQSSRSPKPGVVPQASLPEGAIGVPDLGEPFPDYVIGPQDVLDIQIFREPDLSLEEVRVDSGGRFEMALIGKVSAVNKTPDELSAEISERYAERYLVDPSVVVNVNEVNSKRLTVEGEVENPGVYALEGKTDLISAVAIGGGTSDVAKLKDVAVFRKINGQNMVAVFDLSRVRSGEQANPEIIPGDIVVVGLSNLRQGFQDFLRLAPALTIFRPFN